MESVLPRMRDGRQAFFLFLPDGDAPTVGSVFRNPDLAATFRPPVMEARRWLQGLAPNPDRPLINVSQAAPVDPPPRALREALAEAAVFLPLCAALLLLALTRQVRTLEDRVASLEAQLQAGDGAGDRAP